MGDDQFDETDFVRAQFFVSDEEFAAMKQAAAAKQAQRQRRQTLSEPRRQEIRALRAIVRGFNALEGLGDNQIRAALNYINDRYGKKFQRPRYRL